MTQVVPSTPQIWTISGADCSGGAGIAADIKTGQCFNVEVCHLITANTVQNGLKLTAINPIDVDVLEQQAQSLLEIKTPNAIKVGLIASQEQLNWLIKLITSVKNRHPQLKVIVDPVGHATVGGKLSLVEPQALAKLLPLTDIITPNLLEAQSLASSTSINTSKLAKIIASNGVKSVIVKGGHSEDKDACQDVCIHQLSSLDTACTSLGYANYSLTSARVNTAYSHGGGCSFATAMAALIAQGYLVRDAFMLSKTFITQGLVENEGKNDFYGAFKQLPLNYYRAIFPEVSEEISKTYQNISFPSLNISRDGTQSLGLYPVVDSIAWLKLLLPLNLNIIQLRIKDVDDETLEKLIIEAVELCKNTSTRLFINDYWQLAIKHKAYGVHIGQEDLADTDLAKIEASGIRLGISTHGCYEFIKSQQLKPSYLAIGAIFPTNTKDMTGQIQGVDNLSKLLKLSTDIPVVAIGGINLKNVEEVWQIGVDSVAVVTAITKANSPENAVAAFQALTTDSTS